MSFCCDWQISAGFVSALGNGHATAVQQQCSTSWPRVPTRRCRQSAGRAEEPAAQPDGPISKVEREWSGVLLLVGPRRDRVHRGFHAIQSWLQAGVALLCTDCTLTLVLAHSHSHTHSCPPRRRFLDRSTCSGCTTRRCRVKASFLLNVFSSAHSGQCTFCFLAL
jgi:hypothetical protein